MTFDTHSIFAISKVVNVVSQSANVLVVDITPGDGSLFAVNQQLTIATLSQNAPFPFMGNAMIARLTGKVTDRLTISYSGGNREGTNVHTVQVGDYISNSITPKALTDIEAATGGGGGGDVTVHEKDLTLNASIPIFSIPVASFDIFGAVINGNISADDGVNISITPFVAEIYAYNQNGTSPDLASNISYSQGAIATDNSSFISLASNFAIHNALNSGVITFSALLNTFGFTPTHLKLFFSLTARTAQTVTYL